MPAPWLAGVCSGLSVHSGYSVRAIRWLFVLTGLLGAGALLYLWLWLTVPADHASSSDAGRLQRNLSPVSGVGAADQTKATTRGQFVIAGIAFLVAALVVALVGLWNPAATPVLLPLAAVILGLILVWTQVPSLTSWRTPRVASMVGAGVCLVVVGAIFLVARNDPLPVLLRGMMVGLVVLIGIAVALLPLWFRLIQNVREANASKARETERADIAAHLHDSVLQTLTLIRASADDPKRVRALALRQERELRSWLYTGHDTPADSAAGALREIVTAAETTHGIEAEMVAVGDTVAGPGELAAIAAAGEALTNAMRHGAPPIAVYLEVRGDYLDLFVKDAGPGFDIDQVPTDRHGVRDSIIGRTQRAGGKVKYRDLRPGTEVHISVPLTPKENNQ